MSSRPGGPARATAPLLLGLFIQAGLLAVVVAIALISHARLFVCDAESRHAQYAILYEASSNRDFAYLVTENHFTPTAILANASLTVLSQPTAALVFECFSAAALLAACWLTFRALTVDSESRDKFAQFAFFALAAALSGPALATLNEGTVDGFTALLLAVAAFLSVAALTPEAGDAAPERRKRLDYLAGLALAVAIGLNPFCLVLLIPVLLCKRFRITAGIGAGLVLVFVVSPRMWIDYGSVYLSSSEFLYKPGGNASIMSALQLFARPEAGLTSYPPPPVLAAVVLAAVFVCINFLADLKSDAPANPKTQAALLLTYIPLALAAPATVEAQSLTLNLLLLPALVYFWQMAEDRVARSGLAVAIAGWALTQSHIPNLEQVHTSLFPYAIGGVGTVLLLSGLLLNKVSNLLPRASVEERSASGLRGRRRLVAWAVAAVLMAYVCWGYARFGDSASVLAAWVLTLAVLFFGLRTAEQRGRRISRRDCGVALVLAAVFFAPYVFYVHDYPVQVNPDEIIALHVMRRLVSSPHDWFNVDPPYFFFPNGSFMLIGKLSNWLGGVTLEHVRQVNAFFGVCCVAAGYAFFRQFFRWKLAAAGAVLVGASHVLLGLSRMAIRDNLPLLIELTAFSLLVAGWRAGKLSLILLGGFVAGLGVYNYYSARIVLLVWIGFIGVHLLVRWSPEHFLRTLKIGAVSAAGFFICAAPMLIVASRLPTVSLKYPREQVVLFPEGRDLLRDWENTPDTALALARNSGKGLTMFNNNVFDHANIYINRGYGFVDPLTGVLLWFGIARIFFRRRRSSREILVLSGLLLIWLPLSLVLTKNPAYSRFLITLPFVLALALDGARYAAWIVTRLVLDHPRRATRWRVFAIVVVLICAWNGWAYARHIRTGVARGDAPGNTIRYVEAHRDLHNHAYYVVMDNKYPYYWFGKTDWKPWVQFFAAKDQTSELLDSTVFLQRPEELQLLNRPCSIFISGALYEKCSRKLHESFPDLKITKMNTDGAQLVLEL